MFALKIRVVFLYRMIIFSSVNKHLSILEVSKCMFPCDFLVDYFLNFVSLSSIGSGLHTFVLYLGPHIAFFTIKAMKCGRVDIKSASYDTIQLKRGPSWLGKDCAEFGPPLFPSSDGVSIPLSSILPQVQLEAVLWGLGTALGELPPYFISRAGTSPI